MHTLCLYGYGYIIHSSFLNPLNYITRTNCSFRLPPSGGSAPGLLIAGLPSLTHWTWDSRISPQSHAVTLTIHANISRPIFFFFFLSEISDVRRVPVLCACKSRQIRLRLSPKAKASVWLYRSSCLLQKWKKSKEEEVSSHPSISFALVGRWLMADGI